MSPSNLSVDAGEPIVVAASDSRSDNDRLCIVACGAVIVLLVWFGMIATSFWLDEAGTWWIVKDGPAEAVHRALSWSGQSPFYYLIAWLFSRLFGLNEIALRAPSVLAVSGATYFLYRIGERLIDRAAAALSAFVFLCAASFYAVDARPYALALVCLAASVWLLLRWIETNRLLDAILYVVTATLVVYAHVLLSLGLAAGIVYAVAVLHSVPRRIAWVAGLQAAIVILCIPLFTELRTFYSSRAAHTFLGSPAPGDLLAGLIPCSLIGALVLVAWTFMSLRPEAGIKGRCSGNAVLLIGTWSIFPPLFLYLLAVSTDLSLYVDRYFSSALPGQALMAGAVLASIPKSAVRRALILAVAVVAILSQTRIAVSSHGNDDWRDAMAFVRAEAGSAPVLLVSPFVEGRNFEALRDARLRDVLFAPQKFYGEPKNSIHLPHTFPLDDVQELERATAPLAGERRFFLIIDKPDWNYGMWLLGRLGPRCSTQTTGSRFGYVWVTRFTCE